MRPERHKTSDRGVDEREPVLVEPELGNRPAGEPGNDGAAPVADRPPTGREGIVSNPDF